MIFVLGILCDPRISLAWMVACGSSFCNSRLHKHVRFTGNYGLRSLPLSVENCFAIWMALDIYGASGSLIVISISLLRRSYLWRQRLSARLADVPKVQCHLMVFLFCCRRHVHSRPGQFHPVQRSKARLWKTPWSKEFGSTDANAWNRKHSIISFPRRS